MPTKYTYYTIVCKSDEPSTLVVVLVRIRPYTYSCPYQYP
jgi:hypothetical protein